MDRFIFLLYVIVFVIFSFVGCDISNKKDSKVQIVDEFSINYNKGYIYYNGELFTGILESRFGNGNMKSKYKVSNGIRSDYYLFDINGSIIEKRSKTTDSTYYIFVYYENGKLKSHSNYLNGKLHGNSVYYDENGKIVIDKYYTKGVIQSEMTVRADDFRITSDSIRTNINYGPDGEINGGIMSAFENGGENANYTYFKKGLKNGPSVSFFKNGRISSIIPYIEGEQIGRNVLYHENGKLKHEYYTNNIKGKLIFDGKALSYYENGKLKSEVNYINGKIDGRAVSYYENGKLKSEGNFRAGARNGIFKKYDQNGELLNEIYFQNDSIINVEPK